MKIYVSASAYRDGDGTQARPFKHINDAAKVAPARRRGVGGPRRLPGIC